MCDNWKNDYSSKFVCDGVVLDSGEGEYIVKGYLSSAKNSTILFWAPNPPTYTQSYSGSGLPYANPNMAYENTPNRGAVKATNGKFEFRVKYPNSYYVGLGTVYVEPSCQVKICGTNSDNKIHTIKLGNGIPFRMLTYPPSFKTIARENAHFYDGRDKMPVRTQEKILRDSGYPIENNMPKNFWGTTPPHP